MEYTWVEVAEEKLWVKVTGYNYLQFIWRF